MKIRLLGLFLGATLLGSSQLTLAGPDKFDRYDRPRAEHRQDRYRETDRRGKHAHNGRHKQRGHDYRWDKPRRHAHGDWHRPYHDRGYRHRHGWSKGRHYGHYKRHPVPRAHHHRHRQHWPSSSLSIILHGHF